MAANASDDVLAAHQRARFVHHATQDAPGHRGTGSRALRGLLLNAYAFWKIGQIALLASIASFALAGLMLVLTMLGFWHLRRVSPTEELMAPTINSQKAHMPA